MYLSKLWREGRILTIIAAVALLLQFAGLLRFDYFISSVKANHPDPQQIAGGIVGFLLGILYTESILVSFWGWLSAGIGLGKNLGEDSGSFLLTRPRRRAWFLWNDWGYTMAQIAAVILAANLIFLFSMERILALLHVPAAVPLDSNGGSVSLFVLMLLVSIAVLLVAGLIFGISYFSTILMKRTSGVMLGAGILLGYFILRAVLHHYAPSVHLPDLVMNVFNLGHHAPHELTGHLGANIIARAVVMLAFPFAAQLILDRSEI